jgi:hypothetical protein
MVCKSRELQQLHVSSTFKNVAVIGLKSQKSHSMYTEKRTEITLPLNMDV